MMYPAATYTPVLSFAWMFISRVDQYIISKVSKADH